MLRPQQPALRLDSMYSVKRKLNHNSTPTAQLRQKIRLTQFGLMSYNKERLFFTETWAKKITLMCKKAKVEVSVKTVKSGIQIVVRNSGGYVYSHVHIHTTEIETAVKCKPVMFFFPPLLAENVCGVCYKVLIFAQSSMPFF